MEVESSSRKDGKSMSPRASHHHHHGSGGSSRKRGIKICIGVMAVLLAVLILIVILAFTVFKAKRPVTNVNSVSVKDLQLSIDVLRLRVNLNVTLDVHVSIHNPNKVGFKFTNSSAFLNYRGELVGEASIPAGKISPDQTIPLNLTLTLLADRLLSNSNVYSDVVSGTLPLSTHTRISGKVQILNLFNIHVVSYTSCDFNVNVLTRSVSNQTCHYKTKL